MPGLARTFGDRRPIFKHGLFQQAAATAVVHRRLPCPEVERICATESVALRHVLFLGPPEDMQAILEAISKVWAHRQELGSEAAR